MSDLIDLRDKAAFVGVGVTPQVLSSKVRGQPGWTGAELEIAAFKNAIEDAGLRKEQIDGLLTEAQGGFGAGQSEYLVLGQALGINPRYGGSMHFGGATAGVLVNHAARAVNAGMAKYVAICYAAGSGGYAPGAAPPTDDAAGPDAIPWSTWGALGPIMNAATSASRHMAVYGTKSTQLGEVAVAFRHHASMDPSAIMQKPITIEDHQESRPIVAPLKLLDCCLVSLGGVCLIVTTKERARDLQQPVVSIRGLGQGFTMQHMERDLWWYGIHQREAVWRAYEMAGVGPEDIQCCQLYDNFTFNVIMWLEHAGFCKPGEGGPFVEGGTLQLGNKLPTNTNGGQISHSHPEGFMVIAEGVQQMRGQCGPRNVPNLEVELVTGRGLTLNCASAMILTKDNR